MSFFPKLPKHTVLAGSQPTASEKPLGKQTPTWSPLDSTQ